MFETEAASRLELTDLAPEPQAEWRRLLTFLGWSDEDRLAASRSVEALFRRGPELVAETYDYLSRVPETAAVLGWEERVDEAHLSERRRFFTIWLARTLGLDTGDEFALYLFRAGFFHAGLGPRRIHVPSEYVVGSTGLILAAFARYLAEAELPADAVAGALAAWSKYLSAQLDLMLVGYQTARELQRGAFRVPCRLYGRLRPLAGAADLQVGADQNGCVADLLRKLFNAHPTLRAEALECTWTDVSRPDSLWTDVAPVYLPRPGWRVLLNGRDLRYSGGFQVGVAAGDELAIFPPGR